MKTETTVPKQVIPPVSLIKKAELATKIRSYIIHARFIILKSQNSHYKNMRILGHLDLCEMHAKFLKEIDGISLKDICQFTLILKKNLEGILPVNTNSSYETCCKNLQNILDQCYSYLNSIKNHG